MSAARGGRPPRYSEAEDAIILGTAHASAEETNRQLVEAGYESRSDNALKQRRYYLTKHGRADTTPSSSTGEEALQKALRRRRQLSLDLEKMESARTQLEAEIENCNSRILELMEQMKQSLA